MPRKSSSPPSVYQLKITLKGTKPPIWRRVLVPGDIRLSDLHSVIQVAMGWENYHLHEFVVNRVRYGQPDPEWGDEVVNESRVRLNAVARGEKVKLLYQYDFGDSWEHELLVEKILPPDPATRYPTCVFGKRACPPEDVGGVWRYPDFLEAIADPKYPEHRDMIEWIGGSFDPEAFDLQAVNRRLATMR